MLRRIYAIFLCARLKKMCNSCAFVIKCYKYCKTGKYLIDMYIWLRARMDTFLLFWQMKAVLLVWSSSQEKFLCGISHTLSTPAKFISLFICPRERSACHVVSICVQWAVKTGFQSAFFYSVLYGGHFSSQLLGFGELIRNFMFVS